MSCKQKAICDVGEGHRNSFIAFLKKKYDIPRDSQLVHAHHGMRTMKGG